MARVIQIHLWMMDKRQSWHESEVINRYGKPQPGKRIVLDVMNPSIVEMKMAVAKELASWKDKILYYYVVVVVEKDDGTIGYRTIVKKTVVV